MSRLLRCALGASIALACSPKSTEPLGGAQGEPIERCEEEQNAFEPQSLLVYKVKDDETLSEIAQKFQIKDGIARLSSINHLRNPNLIRSDSGLLIPPNSPWTDSLRKYQSETIVSPERRFCESKAWSPIKKTRLPAFAQRECKVADCSESSSTQKVCFCESKNEEEAGTFLWIDQQQIKAKWPASPSSFFNKVGEQRAFDVVQLDLDRDSQDEVVVFAFEAANNGVPIGTSRVAVLSEQYSAPLLWTDDGSLENLFVVGDSGCELQSTVWDWYTPQLDVNGLYQKREAYVYQGGTLQKSHSFPAIFQRYGAVNWHTWPKYSEASGVSSSAFGVIESIESKPDAYSPYETTFHIRLTNGELKHFVYQSGYSDSEFEGDWRTFISGIGDETSNTIYPYEYWPAELSKWQGRAVEISSLYREESWQNFMLIVNNE
jgi:hypothetical protein